MDDWVSRAKLDTKSSSWISEHRSIETAVRGATKNELQIYIKTTDWIGCAESLEHELNKKVGTSKLRF